MQTTITSILNHEGECKNKAPSPLSPFYYQQPLYVYMVIATFAYAGTASHTRTTHTHTHIHTYTHTHTHTRTTHTHTPHTHTHTHTHKHTYTKKCNQTQRICIKVSVQNSSCDTTQSLCNWNEHLLWCDVIQSGRYELSFRKKFNAISTPTRST